jgi:molybdate transport system regulatory protein
VKSSKNSVGLTGNLWLNLLEKIDEHGSIAKAAKAVGISNKTAWDMLNKINNLAEKPLVNRMVGGKGGGGSSLTAEGKKIISQFKTIQEAHREFLNSLEKRLGDTGGLFLFLTRMYSNGVNMDKEVLEELDPIPRIDANPTKGNDNGKRINGELRGIA